MCMFQKTLVYLLSYVQLHSSLNVEVGGGSILLRWMSDIIYFTDDSISHVSPFPKVSSNKNMLKVLSWQFKQNKKMHFCHNDDGTANQKSFE